MQGLDFGELTDDQILTLIHAVLQEAADRHPSIAEAAHTAILEEADRLDAMRRATETEAARLREEAKRRVADEAAARVRLAYDELEREIDALRGSDASEEAAQRARTAWREHNADLIRRIAKMRDSIDLHPAVSEALASAVLDQEEQDRLVRLAADKEAAKLRALERERIARETAQRIRDDRAAQEQAATDARSSNAADRALRVEQKKQAEAQQWLRRAAELVGLPPTDITLLFVNTTYGRRVLINEGESRYATKHLVDWTADSGQISTARSLLPRKPELAAFSAGFAEHHRGRTVHLFGAHYDWNV